MLQGGGAMGLFDLFRKGAAAPAAAPRGAGERRFHQDRSLMFDLANTQRLVELVAVPREARDPAWSERFHDAVWTASIYVPQPAVVPGPDGMPYLRLILPSEGVAFDSQCLANLAPGCIDNLSGAALFSTEGHPPDAAHYVFSMGVLDSLLRYDSPDGDPQDI